jgi:hypothetical protein
MTPVRLGSRWDLLAAAICFVRGAAAVPGVRSVSLLGSITTARPNPKDIDLLVDIGDETGVTVLATHARRLQGRAQQLNRGADIFLADEHGRYLGRTCPWRECRPGIRVSCDALHCGRRPHLHDDLKTLRLEDHLVAAPPVTIWPEVVRRMRLPADVERMIDELIHAI